jgi:hypothetical protein
MRLCTRACVSFITGPIIVVFGTAFGISTVESWDARWDFAFEENCVPFFIWLDSGTW